MGQIYICAIYLSAKIAKREFLKKAAQEKKTPIVRREPNPVYLPNEDESKLLLVPVAATNVSKPTPVPLPSPPPVAETQPVQSAGVNRIVERPSELVTSSSQEPVSHHRHHHHHHHHHHDKNPDRPHSHKKKKSNGNGGGIPSSNSSTIVGNVGSGLGSPRNITAEYQSDEEDPESRIQVISSRRPVKSGNMNTSNSTYTMYKNATTGEVQIPIQRVDRLDYEPTSHTHYNYQQPSSNLGRGSYTNVNMQGSGSRGNLNSGSRRNVTTLSEYSDSKVAYRLASTEQL